MSRVLKALIVDDERLARRELISLLASFECIHVIGEAEDVPSAVQAITAQTPDVIFLDIQMPGQSGFDLIELIPAPVRVIFVTAYDEFAIRAFDVNALDYLMKPINPDRLRLAVSRLCDETPPPAKPAPRLAYDDRLYLLLNTQYRFLKINSIVHISAAGDYSEVTTADGKKWLASKALREWDLRLPERQFCRIRRSEIVNLDFVDHVEEWQYHSFRVFLRGIAEPFILSRRYAAILKDRFK
jgi:two-component system, LytTR family, response regulator